ncbi:uncharacterized protein BX663DRAFT_409748, partial [Cokeromyces recurvatus]|uniref:uncharacterized protein n=1 Tax=Cokeromyces recurvatus TaxID=90255 RepID=UPI002220DA35
FFYEDEQKNLHNKQRIKVYNPMKNVLTQITNPEIVLVTVTNRKNYYKLKPLKKMVIDDVVKVVNSLTTLTYKNYNDRQREVFINRMIGSAQQRGL